MTIQEELEYLVDRIEYLEEEIPDSKSRGCFYDAEAMTDEVVILKSIQKRLLSLKPIVLHDFQAKIKNEEGKVIFSRELRAENKERALEILKNRVNYEDDSHLATACKLRDSMIGFGHSGFRPLSASYKDINNIEYIIEEL